MNRPGLPTASIVMPVFNGMPWIPEAVASVLAQEGVDVELIVLDAGSTDGTRAWLAANPHPSMQVVLEPDRGQSDAIRKGLERARGEILGWLNADDILEPGALSTAAAVLATHPEASMVSGSCRIIDTAGRVIGHIDPPPAGTLAGLLHWPRNLAQPATLFRAEAFRRTAGLDLRLHYAMDVDLWLKLARVGPAILLPGEVLARFREHPAAKSSRAATAMVREELRVRLRHGLEPWSRAALTLARWGYLRPAKRRLLSVLRRGGAAGPA